MEDEWTTLLEDKNVRREVRKIKRQFLAENPADIARRGLEKIVFGQGYTENIPGEQASDNFQVAEIKCPKAGGTEIKFWDKIKALELLIRLSESRPETEKNKTSIFEALEKGARALNGHTIHDEPDELDGEI